MPIIYNSDYGVKEVYVQVLGADGQYYTVTPTIVTGANGFSYITIDIPAGITNGKFTIQYKVKDQSGSVSNLVSTSVEVTNVVTSCENTHKKGESGLTFSNITMGNKSGRVTISYDTYSVPDRIDIYQGERWVTGTGANPNSPIPPLCDCNKVKPGDGFVGKSGTLRFDYEPKNGKIITVVVSGCLNGGTSWEWTLTESPECN